MRNRPILAAGRKLVRWLSKGGRPERVPRSVLWLYRWRAFWLEQHFALLRGSGPAAQPFPFRDGNGLVFILGFWRSGTTLLHELLAEAPACGVPRTWQCLDPSALLLSNGTPSSAAILRPMDRVMVTSDSPQEDEFALMAMGVPSVYQGFLDPRRLPELEAMLRQDYWCAAGPGWMEALECFLSWCRVDGLDRMVVKSPNHLFRYRALATRYPQARFVWILRSPKELWRSNLGMWRAMIARYGLWSTQGSELEAFLEKALTAYGDLLEQLHHEGGFHQQPVFSYESLVANPEAVLPPVTKRLGLASWDTWGPAILPRVVTTPDKSRKTTPTLVSELPEILLARLDRIHKAILLEHGSGGTLTNIV